MEISIAGDFDENEVTVLHLFILVLLPIESLLVKFQAQKYPFLLVKSSNFQWRHRKKHINPYSLACSRC